MRRRAKLARNAMDRDDAAEFLGAVDEEGDVAVHLKSPPPPFS